MGLEKFKKINHCTFLSFFVEVIISLNLYKIGEIYYSPNNSRNLDFFLCETGTVLPSSISMYPFFPR